MTRPPKNGIFRYVLYLLEFTAGMAMSVTGSILPDISDVFSLSGSVSASIPAAQFMGGFTALVFIGFVFPLVKPKLLLLCAAAKLTLAAIFISVLGSFSFAVLAAFFCIGASMSVIFVMPGVITSCEKDGKGAESMNILYSFMSAGVVVSPVVSGLLFERGSHYPAVFAFIAATTFVSAVITALTGFPEFSLGKGLSVAVIKGLAGRHSSFFITVLVMSLCYMGAEAVPNNWIPKYLSDSFPGFSEFRSRLVLSLFWACITSGRYILRLSAALLEKAGNPACPAGCSGSFMRIARSFDEQPYRGRMAVHALRTVFLGNDAHHPLLYAKADRGFVRRDVHINTDRRYAGSFGGQQGGRYDGGQGRVRHGDYAGGGSSFHDYTACGRRH